MLCFVELLCGWSSVMNVEIRNITATGDFRCVLDLRQIFSWLPLAVEKNRLPIEVKYNVERFKGLTLRILYPVKATVLLFHTGKVVCIGTKSLQQLEEAGHQFTHILILLGYQPIFSGFRVCNMVSSWSSGGRLNIEKLYTEQGGFYEPERFPAMQYYVNNVTLLIFYTGKVVATGAKRQEELNVAHEKISCILKAGDYFK